MTIADITKNLPLLLVTALLFALIGWWLRGRRKTVPAATATPASLKSSAGPSNSERQRLREVEAKLRTCESAAESAGAALASLKKTSVALTEHEVLRAELEIARTNAAALDTQLKKSREIQAGLQAQANDAGKKVQARAITLENDLAAARTDIQRLKTLSEPNTEGMKRLEAEIETVRTRLRAVEAQLAERNAELNAQKASALAATVRPPRTVAARETSPGGALNLLGVESTPVPASPVNEAAPTPAYAPSGSSTKAESAAASRAASEKIPSASGASSLSVKATGASTPSSSNFSSSIPPAAITTTAAPTPASASAAASAATLAPASTPARAAVPANSAPSVPPAPSALSAPSTAKTPDLDTPVVAAQAAIVPPVAAIVAAAPRVADLVSAATSTAPDSKSDPIPASAAVAKAVQPGSTNREATELPTDTGALPLPGQAAKPEALLSPPISAVDSKEPVAAVRSVSSSPGAATQQELPLLKLTFADTILPEDSILENPVAGFAATHPALAVPTDDEVVGVESPPGAA